MTITRIDPAYPQRVAGSSSLLWPLCLITVLLMALSPMIFYPLGIASDYPNHLARVHIEHRLADSAALQEHFQLDWGIYPDLAMDLFMRPLMSVMGPYAAGAAFNVLAAAMVPIGVALLAWVVTGRVGLPVLASVLLVYGQPLAWGFINYVFTAGLALCLLALWIWMRPGWTRTAVFAALMPLLFFSHVLGFLLFGFLMLAYEIGRYLADERGTFARFAAGLVLRDGLIAVVPLGLFAASFSARMSKLDPEVGGYGGLASRAEAVLAPFDYGTPGLSSALIMAGLLIVLIVALARGWLTLSAELRPVVLAGILLVVAVPAAFSGIALLNIRFGFVPFAILLAGASVTDGGRKRALPLCALLWGLFALQQVTVHERMAMIDRHQQEVRVALSSLPDGTRLLVGSQEDPRRIPMLVHMPALVVIEADGYVANLFTNTSPVAVTPQAAPLHRPQAGPIPRETLYEAADRDPPRSMAENGMQEDYFHGWPQTFDAVFWFDIRGGAPLESPHLEEVARGGMFRIYAVNPGSARP